MERVFDDGTVEVWTTHIVRPFVFSSPIAGREFAALVLFLDREVSPDEQAAISASLIAEGCRYAVCAGDQCSTWDDSVDMAYLATDSNRSPPEDRFVMTSWHEDEGLEDVAHFLRLFTAFDRFVPTLFVAVVIGGGDTEYESARRVVRQQWDVA